MTTAAGDPVQPWHGVAVFKSSKQNKIKLYAMPLLALEGVGATPVMFLDEVAGDLEEYALRNQPLFYIHPDIQFNNLQDFFDQLRRKLTRSRKSN
jgi:hypothetical protein